MTYEGQTTCPRPVLVVPRGRATFLTPSLAKLFTSLGHHVHCIAHIHCGQLRDKSRSVVMHFSGVFITWNGYTCYAPSSFRVQRVWTHPNAYRYWAIPKHKTSNAAIQQRSNTTTQQYNNAAMQYNNATITTTQQYNNTTIQQHNNNNNATITTMQQLQRKND
eukprot:scaffold694_cov180-Alexandrium_tamarense.AAC.14